MDNICAWNVRGLNKVRKQVEVAQFISTNNIHLFGLLETKVKRAGLGALYLRLCPNWCLTSNLAWHDGSRIVVVWRSESVQVDILQCSDQLIHLEVTSRMGARFMCTFVYGSNCRKERLSLFHQLADISRSCCLPWLVLGDFNCVANLTERIGAPVRLHEVAPL